MLDTGSTPVGTQSINTLLAPLRVLYSMETVEKNIRKNVFRNKVMYTIYLIMQICMLDAPLYNVLYENRSS